MSDFLICEDCGTRFCTDAVPVESREFCPCDGELYGLDLGDCDIPYGDAAYTAWIHIHDRAEYIKEAVRLAKRKGGE